MRKISQLLFTSLCLLSPAALSAQQMLCLSVHGGPAVGNIPTGVGGVAPTHITARVAGTWVPYYVHGGETAAAVSAQHEAAFQAAGYTTLRVNPNEFCVTAAPGGGNVVQGSLYFTDDPELDLDSRVAVDDSIASPDTKDDGVLIALPRDTGLPGTAIGTVDIELEALSLTGTVTRTVALLVDPTLPAASLRDSMQLQLEQQGLHANRVFVEDPAQPSHLLEVLQVERTAAGERVVWIHQRMDAAARARLPMVTGAGVTPVFGTSEYGRASQGTWSRCDGTPQLGGSCTLVHELQQPFAVAIDALALAPFVLPVFGGTLLVDPGTLVLEAGFTDGSGALVRSWAIPSVATLVGAVVCSQGIALDPSWQFPFSTGLRVALQP